MDSEEEREGGNRMGNERGEINEKNTLADRPPNNFERKEMKRKQKQNKIKRK